MNRKIFENFIFLAIILVIIQTYLDDYSQYAHYSVSFRNMLLIAGFIFDAIFTMEFILRCIWAMKEKNVKAYLLYQRGWVDFLASAPLLLLNSGPSLIIFLKGGLAGAGTSIAVLNIFKIVKAIRVTRILRLIRLLKIFGKIHNAESKMAQRHITSIATTGVFAIISVLIILSLFQFTKFEHLKTQRIEHYNNVIENIEHFNRTHSVPLKNISFEIFSNDKNILKMTYADFLIFSNISDEILSRYYLLKEDYDIISNEATEFEIYVSYRDLNQSIAAVNIQNFFIIVIMILAYMFFYTRHFVQTVSDIIHIIKRGMSEKDYNLEVKIQEPYKEDEIFELAQYYNENYLPKKVQQQQEEKEKKATVLSMNDLLDFGKK